MPARPAVPQASSRDRLLQAAKRLFAAHGYEQTATSAIAREAGTSESQLMRYFGGKVGLLEALFDEAWQELNARVTKIVEQPGSPREAILNVLQAIAAALAKDPDLATLFLFEGRRLRGDSSRVRISSGLVTFSEIARGLVRRAQAANEIDPALDAAAITSAIMGATEALIRDRTMARSSGTRSFPEREIHRTLSAILAGFGSDTRLSRVETGAAKPRAARRTK